MVNFSGELAALIPGHNKAIDITQENGSSYIDDFEGSQSAIDIRTINNWVLASVPQGQPICFQKHLYTMISIMEKTEQSFLGMLLIHYFTAEHFFFNTKSYKRICFTRKSFDETSTCG